MCEVRGVVEVFDVGKLEVKVDKLELNAVGRTVNTDNGTREFVMETGGVSKPNRCRAGGSFRSVEDPVRARVCLHFLKVPPAGQERTGRKMITGTEKPIRKETGRAERPGASLLFEGERRRRKKP